MCNFEMYENFVMFNILSYQKKMKIKFLSMLYFIYVRMIVFKYINSLERRDWDGMILIKGINKFLLLQQYMKNLMIFCRKSQFGKLYLYVVVYYLKF